MTLSAQAGSRIGKVAAGRGEPTYRAVIGAGGDHVIVEGVPLDVHHGPGVARDSTHGRIHPARLRDRSGQSRSGQVRSGPCSQWVEEMSQLISPGERKQPVRKWFPDVIVGNAVSPKPAHHTRYVKCPTIKRHYRSPI